MGGNIQRIAMAHGYFSFPFLLDHYFPWFCGVLLTEPGISCENDCYGIQWTLINPSSTISCDGSS